MRNFIHQEHFDKSLTDSWQSDQLPPDIKQHLKEQKKKRKQRRKKSTETVEEKPHSRSSSPDKKALKKKKTKRHSQSLFDLFMVQQQETELTKMDVEELEVKEDDENINPNKITMEMDSMTVATLSVNYYMQQIEKNKEFISTNEDGKLIISALYDDAARFHWCLQPFKLMYYFISFAIFIISASGTNTPSERGIKAVKYFATPERNRMKGPALNALNLIHEKIIEDDFNEEQENKSIEAAQACKIIMCAFGMHTTEPTSSVYQKLLEEIAEKTKYIKTGILNIIFLNMFVSKYCF